MITPQKQPSRAEFIGLSALLMSVVSLSIDVMLPALGALAADLQADDGNQRQWVITVIFMGLVLGQLLFGPASDAYGRRKTIIIGIALFIAGTAICTFAQSYAVFLAGRFLQGVGAAGPRIGTVAMVRDRFSGVEMAKIMSLIMGIFIFVPIFAPMLGQVLLWVMPWRGLFAALMVVLFTAGCWLVVRQPETLHKPTSINYSTLKLKVLEVLKNRQAMFITLASACAYGALMGYINSSQQVLQELYVVGDAFGFWFGLTAVFISAATFINVALVKHFSMLLVCQISMLTVTALALMFAVLLYFLPQPTLEIWIGFNCLVMFFLGLTFGNFTAFALQHLGHVAGLASSLTGALNTGIGSLIAATVGLSFNGTVFPITVGYVIFAAMSLIFTLLVVPKKITR